MSLYLVTRLVKDKAMDTKFYNEYTREKLLNTKKEIMFLQSIGSRQTFSKIYEQ